MKNLSKLIAGSLCAATMAMSGCDNIVTKWKFRNAYDPVSADIRKDPDHPIDAKISYWEDKKNGYVNGFTIRKKTKDSYVRIRYTKDHDQNKVSSYISERPKRSILLEDYVISNDDGVDIIVNHITNRKCYSYQEPRCSSSTKKKADELLLNTLKDMKFRKHIWYFNKRGRDL